MYVVEVPQLGAMVYSIKSLLVVEVLVESFIDQVSVFRDQLTRQPTSHNRYQDERVKNAWKQLIELLFERKMKLSFATIRKNYYIRE